MDRRQVGLKLPWQACGAVGGPCDIAVRALGAHEAVELLGHPLSSTEGACWAGSARPARGGCLIETSGAFEARGLSRGRGVLPRGAELAPGGPHDAGIRPAAAVQTVVGAGPASLGMIRTRGAQRAVEASGAALMLTSGAQEAYCAAFGRLVRTHGAYGALALSRGRLKRTSGAEGTARGIGHRLEVSDWARGALDGAASRGVGPYVTAHAGRHTGRGLERARGAGDALGAGAIGLIPSRRAVEALTGRTEILEGACIAGFAGVPSGCF